MTSPASLSTLRCCETAGRLTGSPLARSPTADGRLVRRSKIVRLVRSPRADHPASWLVATHSKLLLTKTRRQQSNLSATGPRDEPLAVEQRRYEPVAGDVEDQQQHREKDDESGCDLDDVVCDESGHHRRRDACNDAELLRDAHL